MGADRAGGVEAGGADKIGETTNHTKSTKEQMKVPGYRTISEALGLIPGMAGVVIRRAWYRRTLAKCGARLFVDWLAVFKSAEACVGDDCYIGVRSWIGVATIGDGTLISSGVQVLSGLEQHGIARDQPVRSQMGGLQRVYIGEDCWIGAGAIVGADLALGTVVGAGSVVVQPTEAFWIVAGNPARVVRERN